FFQNGKYNLGRFRLWVTTAPVVRFGAPAAVAAALKLPADKRAPAQKSLLTAHFLEQAREYQVQKENLVIARRPLPADPQELALTAKLAEAEKPILLDPKLLQLRRDAGLSEKQLTDRRLTAAQDLAWA